MHCIWWESRNSVPNGIYLCSVDSLLTTPSQWGIVNFLGKADPSERLGRHKKSGTLRGRRMPDGKTGDGQLPLLHCGYFDL